MQAICKPGSLCHGPWENYIITTAYRLKPSFVTYIYAANYCERYIKQKNDSLRMCDTCLLMTALTVAHKYLVPDSPDSNDSNDSIHVWDEAFSSSLESTEEMTHMEMSLRSTLNFHLHVDDDFIAKWMKGSQKARQLFGARYGHKSFMTGVLAVICMCRSVLYKAVINANTVFEEWPQQRVASIILKNIELVSHAHHERTQILATWVDDVSSLLQHIYIPDDSYATMICVASIISFVYVQHDTQVKYDDYEIVVGSLMMAVEQITRIDNDYRLWEQWSGIAMDVLGNIETDMQSLFSKKWARDYMSIQNTQTMLKRFDAKSHEFGSQHYASILCFAKGLFDPVFYKVILQILEEDHAEVL